MSLMLLLGNEALAWGAAHGGASFYAAPSLPAAAEVDHTFGKFLSGEHGSILRTGDAAQALSAVLEASPREILGVASVSAEQLSEAAPFFARAAAARTPALFVVVGTPAEEERQLESASQREMAILRWLPGSLRVYVPASSGECYAVARAAAWEARRMRTAVLLYVDHVIAHLREPVELDSESNRPALGGTEATSPGSNEASEDLPAAELYRTRDAAVVVVAVGIVARAARTAVRLARDRGLRAGLFRPMRLRPFPGEELVEAAGRARHVIVPELNEGQLWEPVAAVLQAGEERPRVHALSESRLGRIEPARIAAALAEAGT